MPKHQHVHQHKRTHHQTILLCNRTRVVHKAVEDHIQEEGNHHRVEQHVHFERNIWEKHFCFWLREDLFITYPEIKKKLPTTTTTTATNPTRFPTLPTRTCCRHGLTYPILTLGEELLFECFHESFGIRGRGLFSSHLCVCWNNGLLPRLVDLSLHLLGLVEFVAEILWGMRLGGHLFEIRQEIFFSFVLNKNLVTRIDEMSCYEVPFSTHPAVSYLPPSSTFGKKISI